VDTAGPAPLTAGGIVAVRLRAMPAARAALAALRGEPGLDVHVAADELWLRARSVDASVVRRLAALPGAELFEVDDRGLGRRPNGRIPRAHLPAGPWQALAACVACALPAAALAASRLRPVELRLVRGGDEQPVNALLTELVPFARFALGAAAVRLQPLRFALAADRRVLVHGLPLAPVPGLPLVEAHGVALPAGHRLLPAVPLALVARQLALQPGDLACFTVDGTYRRMPADVFVAATRSAVRLALRKVGSDG
jgi:hypothetical protein